jgi:hypothetical protein
MTIQARRGAAEIRHEFIRLVAVVLSSALVAAAQNAPENGVDQPVIPAGSKILLVLKEAISTRNAKAGDPVYAETLLPFFVDGHMLVPPGTTVLGVITSAKRARRTRGRAEIEMNFTSMIYSNGYTVALSGPVYNTPGADNLSVTSEGAIQQDSDTGRKIADGGRNAAHGMLVGSMGGLFLGTSITAMRAAGGAGIALGMGWALFRRGSDMKLQPGTHIEMAVTLPIALDVARLPGYANRELAVAAGSVPHSQPGP